jgi:hypothetical protein
MASYHFSVKSKNKGYGLQHYLYISRLMQYEGIRKTSQETIEHIEPGHCMPAFVKDPIEFWQAADTYERANAKAYMEYEIALPNEFTPEQRKTLIEAFLEKHVARFNYPHSYAIHNVKSRISGEDQPHCHLMFSLKANDGIERTAEQYFKRYNAKDPSKGGAKKIQLQDQHEDYSAFLLYIRKEWENHLNMALAQYAPTVKHLIDGQEIILLNRVSADSYEKYNEQHGTLYLAEPKLGVGKQNETVEYLQEIQKIRQHNAHEWEMEQKQKHFDQQHDFFYSCMNEPFSSLEVIHYLKYLNQHAKDREKIKDDLSEILKTQKPIIEHEKWNTHHMNSELKDSQLYSIADIKFTIHQAPESSTEYLNHQVLTTPLQHRSPEKEINPPKKDDYDFGGPDF